MTQGGGRIIRAADPRYPLLLRELPDMPEELYIRGTLPDLARPALAIVGTRRLTAYGKEWTERITNDLAQADMLIISGMARGIDAIGHRAALLHNVPTIAVLGTGCDDESIFPQEHLPLTHEIIENGGCLISEYPPGTHGSKMTFPERNRIIAGLTLGTLVTEAPVGSGALITAEFALDYNREVFTIPHPLGNWSGEGCNNLLHDGAHLVRSAQDIFDVLRLEINKDKKTIKGTNETETKILAALSHEPLHVDALILATGLSSRDLATALSLLELRGAVKNVGEMKF